MNFHKNPPTHSNNIHAPKKQPQGVRNLQPYEQGAILFLLNFLQYSAPIRTRMDKKCSSPIQARRDFIFPKAKPDIGWIKFKQTPNKGFACSMNFPRRLAQKVVGWVLIYARLRFILLFFYPFILLWIFRSLKTLGRVRFANFVPRKIEESHGKIEESCRRFEESHGKIEESCGRIEEQFQKVWGIMQKKRQKNAVFSFLKIRMNPVISRGLTIFLTICENICYIYIRFSFLTW